MNIPDESPSDWESTSHPRVFYRSQGNMWNRGEYALAKFVADHIPGWSIVITMGPYRSYDINYEIYPDDRLIHLDYYSAGMLAYGSEYPERSRHPAVEHAESLIHDIAREIGASDADFDLREP